MSQRYRCDEPEQRALGLGAAAAAVRRGALVVLPTETSYAVVTDAFAATGVARMREALGREPDSPIPVLVGRASTLEGLVLTLGDQARALIEGFWPGPLTLVVPAAPSLHWDLGDTGGTVSARMPLHPVALELLRATGPLAATAAGSPPPRSVDAAQALLGEAVAVYLDGGECPEGPASTVVDVSGAEPQVLRPGALSVEALREVLPGLEQVAP